MIITLTPNPAWDITMHAASVTPGASHRVPNGSARAGGKGINVARVLDGQGVAALAVLPVGGATGDLVIADLVSAGLRHAAVTISGQTRRTVAIVDDGAGETSIFNEVGPQLSDGEARALAASMAEAPDDSGVYVGSGSLPPGCPADFYSHLVRAAHDRHLPCIIDASGAALLAAADAGADLVKPNVEEITAATGLDDPFAAAAELLARGARRVLLSDGARGMYDVAPGEPTLHARLNRAVSGNATGAGDAAVAAAATILDGRPRHGEPRDGEPRHGEPRDGDSRREALLRRAVAWSASAVTMPVAGELPGDAPSWEDAVRITSPS